MTPAIPDASRAFHARAWGKALHAYRSIDAAQGLTQPVDLERFAVAAFMMGRLPEYFDVREREYAARVETGDRRGAARTAMWIGTQRLLSGQEGTGAGWIARAVRHVSEDDADYLERGYVLLTGAFATLAAGDGPGAVRITEDALAVGERFGDDDLTALALHQKGLFLLRIGETPQGMAALDEAMVIVGGGAVSPMVSGIVYCGVITGCWQIYDIGRAQEWTAAMSLWCQEQPEMGNFTGECRLRRAQLKELRGLWPQAREDAVGVDEEVDPESAAAAAYLRGNLDRLRGSFADAEHAFGEAARLGLEPQPGLALLRLAQGSTQAAAAMVRRAGAEIHGPARRVELLCAATEILLAIGDEVAAADAATELEHQRSDNRIVMAFAAQARAMVHVHAGSVDLALGPLRAALRTWIDVDAPYQEARTRALLARGYRAMGDDESADRERELARGLLTALGAAPDLAQLDRRDGGGPLTDRELQVLRMVTHGRTNRSIAAELVISERTVDRHLSNILAKLGVSTRTAATAAALERKLL